MREVSGDAISADDQAAAWFARLRSDNVRPADRDRFARWLESDPANAAAYADCETMWVEAQDAAADDIVGAMRQQALALGRPNADWPWQKLTALAATIALVLIAGLLLLRLDRPDLQPSIDGARDAVVIAQAARPRIYRTEIGQRSSVRLADGSVVELNTASVLEVDIGADRRNLRLLRGEALFEVAHDPRRPFVVDAGGQQVVALGTRFEVDLRADETRVTLIEGRVEVRRTAAEGTRPIEVRQLRAGELLIAAAAQPYVVRPTNVDATLSWRTGRLTFTNEPLGEVVEEFNRYTDRRVVLGDPTLAQLRISGVFRTASVSDFVTALDSGFPVSSRVDRASDTIVLTWE